MPGTFLDPIARAKAILQAKQLQAQASGVDLTSNAPGILGANVMASPENKPYGTSAFQTPIATEANAGSTWGSQSPPGFEIGQDAPQANADTDPAANAYSMSPSTVTTGGDSGAAFDPSGKNDRFGAFLNNPAASDALAAFGGAMLSAPSFMEGLGKAALAVNQVDREYRMPTEQEIARAQLKARLKNAQNGGESWSNLGTFYDADGKPYVATMNKYTGEHRNITLDGVRGQDSGIAQQTKVDSDAYGKDSKTYDSSTESYYNWGEVKRLATDPNTAAGPGVVKSFARGLSSLSGINFGADPASMQELTARLNSGYLSTALEKMKGQGQITEGERAIVERASGNLTTDPKAIVQIANYMQGISKRFMDMRKAWIAQGKPTSAGYIAFRDNYFITHDLSEYMDGSSGGQSSSSSNPELEAALNKYKDKK